MAYYIVLGLGLVVSLAFCIKRSGGYSVNNLIFKSVSSLCYLLTAVFALINNPSASTYGTLIIFGGALGLVGDIALDLKGIYKQDEKTYLKAGFIFFLFGHIAYFSSVIYTVKLKWYFILASVIISLVIGVGTILTANVMKVHYGSFRRIVMFYVTFLAMTPCTAIFAMIQTHFEKGFVLLSIGAVSFLISDVVLSNTFFGRGKESPKPFEMFINHFLYYAGQYLIAATVMFVGR